jgi:hypothetical protein
LKSLRPGDNEWLEETAQGLCLCSKCSGPALSFEPCRRLIAKAALIVGLSRGRETSTPPVANPSGVAAREEESFFRKGVLLCQQCHERPAACVGRYEGDGPIALACDVCCGHGCEDGWCVRLASEPARPDGVTVEEYSHD